MSPTDPHSFAHPEMARVTHLVWASKIDFDHNVIKGVATWDIEKSTNAKEIILDTKSLQIDHVVLNGNDTVTFEMGEPDSILGQPLIIPLQKETKKISIYYSTTPGAEALQWLAPQQTAGKEHPFLFTQSQAILARTWIPCQDSPGIRFTYEANVTVPAELLALMSASNPQEKNSEGEYRFEMKQPIPAYLLALTVGDLSFTSISERSGVYAEPSMLEAAAYEFADMEKMIVTAEQLYGPYRWDRYDVIVLPPSFPFGGMENPRLTFVTPTLLAGDRSLTSVIAHELAHSWSGNLVTNATWNDFWLNEGFTVYFETRIMEKLYGDEYAEMLASLNLQDLKDEINSLENSEHPEDTKLKLDLTGRNPDDGVTDVAYNKGYFFLRTIEDRYGRDEFDAFLNTYFSDNAFSSMDTQGFIGYIKDYYSKRHEVTLPDSLFQQWIYQEGLPDTYPRPNSVRFDRVDAVLAKWKETSELEPSVTDQWTTQEWLHFLNNLPDKMTVEQLASLDRVARFTDSTNAEVFAAWAEVAIRNSYDLIYPNLERFLVHTGRRKFLTPLYKELVKTTEGTEMAKKIYELARPNYHFVATQTIDNLLLDQ